MASRRRGITLLLLLAAAVTWWLTSREPLPDADTPPEESSSTARHVPTLEGAAPDEGEAQPTATQVVLTGRVVRSGTHAPMADVLVELRQWRKTTRTATRAESTPDGRFRIAVAVSERETDTPSSILVASAPGAATLYALPEGEELLSQDVGDLVLELGCTVRGVVRDEAGTPVAGARLALDPERPPQGVDHRAGFWTEVGAPATATSDEEGRFAMQGVPRRGFGLAVKAPGCVSAWFQGEAQGAETWIDVRVRRGRNIRVRVVDFNGSPAGGARVNLYPGYRRVMVGGGYKTHVRLDRSTVADKDGQCELTGLGDRNYQITAQLRGMAGAAGYVLPGWDEIEIRLTPGWRSTRYAYEGGPGSGLRLGPPGAYSDFLWQRTPPKPPEPDEPREPPRPAQGDEDDPPEPREPVPAERARLVVAVVAADGVPMPDTYFELEGPETRRGITEDDGTEIVTVEPGRYTYRVSPIDFGTPPADVTGTLDAAAGIEARLEVRMPLVYSLPLRVLRADGDPVPHAELKIERSGKTKRTWTSADGTETIFVERGQPLRIAALTDGPVALLEDVSLPARKPVLLRVAPMLRLRGQVLGPEGTPEFGTRVRAVRQGLGSLAKESWRGWTDAEGNFELEGPAAGATYEVRAEHVAFGAGVEVVEVRDAGAPITLRLGPLPRFRGRLVDSRGAPVPRAEIAIEEGGRGWVGSGDDGRFEMAFPGGTKPVQLSVTHAEFVPLRLSVAPGRDREREVRLSRGVTLIVNVRGATRRALRVETLEAATNRVVPSGPKTYEDTADGASVTIARAPAGAYRVRLALRGKKPKILSYDAREGERVTLEALFD